MWMPLSIPRSSIGFSVSGAGPHPGAPRGPSPGAQPGPPEPSMSTREPTPLEIHKALADDTRFRLYRHLGLSGRPVPIRELAARLSLPPNTLRPHLRRLAGAGPA